MWKLIKGSFVERAKHLKESYFFCQLYQTCFRDTQFLSTGVFVTMLQDSIPQRFDPNSGKYAVLNFYFQAILLYAVANNDKAVFYYLMLFKLENVIDIHQHGVLITEESSRYSLEGRLCVHHVKQYQFELKRSEISTKGSRFSHYFGLSNLPIIGNHG